MPWTEADDDRVREFCKGVDVGALTQCPKCGMGSGGKSEMMLSHFCTHKYCPFREWKRTKDAADRAADPYYAALDAWKKDGGMRPAKRPDGIPTRSDIQWMTTAEIAILNAMKAVEEAGGSVALTDAVTLLSKARDRVADHAEGVAQK
ncbi:MAG: hypothetical protein ABFD89_18615 [Bryobacteraceae bacterium]